MNSEGISRFFLFTGIIFFCVILHELGHSLTARRYNVRTIDIIISPIGGLARLDRIPQKPVHELLIALAGPAVNLMIAACIGLFLLLSNHSFTLIGTEQFYFNYWANFLPLLFRINLVLIIFNLIPAFPMDGGRVLRSLLSMRWNRVLATRWASVVGQSIAIGFFLFGVFHQEFILGFIGLFVLVSANAELKNVHLDEVRDNTLVGDITFIDVSEVHHEEIAANFLSGLKNSLRYILVRDGVQVLGAISRSVIEDIRKYDQLPAFQLIQYRRRISAHLSIRDIVEFYQQNGYEDCLLVFDNNNFVGLIDRESIYHYIKRIQLDRNLRPFRVSQLIFDYISAKLKVTTKSKN